MNILTALALQIAGTGGVSSSALQWLQIAISTMTLAGIVFGVVKVLNRNNEEWRDRERRIAIMEDEIREMHGENRQIIAMGAQLIQLEEEMKRVRDRLDQFLDGRSMVNNA